MKVDLFTEERREAWEECDALVDRAKGRPEQLRADGVLRLGSLYRSAVADLALARRAFPYEPVTERLERLVGRARVLVYDAAPRKRSLRAFFSRDYWRLVRDRPGLLLLAAGLLLVPAVAGGLWAAHDPAAANGFLPGALGAVSDPRPAGESLGFSGSQSAAFSSQILTNNIRVTFLAFAGGISGGLITGAALIFNGLLIGVLGGLSASAGNSERFFALVVAHGVLELSCIVVAGTAGLGIGIALIAPGRRGRGVALRAEARRAVELVLGTAPWLVLAGLIEGFVTPAGYGLTANLVVGVLVGVVFWVLVALRGGRVPSG